MLLFLGYVVAIGAAMGSAVAIVFAFELSVVPTIVVGIILGIAGYLACNVVGRWLER